jgi:hypothetical protein
MHQPSVRSTTGPDLGFALEFAATRAVAELARSVALAESDRFIELAQDARAILRACRDNLPPDSWENVRLACSETARGVRADAQRLH